MDYEMGYHTIYDRVSPAVDRYMNSHMLYAGQGLGDEQIDAMVEDIYKDIIRDYPDMHDAGSDKVSSAQRRRRGFFRSLIGLLLLERLFRRPPYYSPGYGPGYPGYGYGPWY